MSRSKDKEFATFRERVAFVNDPLYNDIFKNMSMSEYGRFVLFRYSRYANIYNESDKEGFARMYKSFWNLYGGIYREARGIVIDIEKGCVAMHPFDKFFNLNENEETKLDVVRERIASARSKGFAEKLDGSMVTARYYDGDYLVASSGSVNPSDSVQLRIAKKYIEGSVAIRKLLYCNANCTFIFELIDPSSPHIIPYSRDMFGLHLIGARDHHDNDRMWSYTDVILAAKMLSIPTVRIFDFTLDELLAKVHEPTAMQEGFVINIDGFFVKLKYDDYVKAHKLFSDTSAVNSIIEAFANGNIDDVLAKTPEPQLPRIRIVVGMVEEYISNVNKIIYPYYEANRHLPIKEYCLALKSAMPKKYQSYAINLYKGRKVDYLKTHKKRKTKTLGDMGFSYEMYLDRLHALSPVN